jgi:hypothetical protein
MRTNRQLMLTLALLALECLAVSSSAAEPQTAVAVSFSTAVSERLRDVYGPEEGEVLRTAITKSVLGALGGSGVARGAANPTSVDVLLESALPSHPTRAQLAREPSLDFLRSRSLGGAALTGTVWAADGRVLAKVSFSDFAPTLALASQAADSWADARRSIERFSAALAAKLKTPR